MPIKAVLCTNCPWRRSAPKAGEVGGSVPVSTNRDHMRQVAHNLFMGYYRRRSAEVGGRGGRHFERLAECIAAEKELASETEQQSVLDKV